jgi:glutaredoxin
MTILTLYGKAGCHLCEEARRVVESVRSERSFDLREVDVSVDPELHRRFGERIPVVEIEGEELFEFHVDPVALRERLDTVDT